MKYYLFILVAVFLIPTPTHAIEFENRLPESVWEVEMRLKHTPVYDRAFNGYGEEAPLQQLMLWDREWRDSVVGKLQREEQRLEIRMTYGLTEKWMLEATIPLLQKKQTSTLKIESATAIQQKILENLASENLSGLGDIKLKFAKDTLTTTTWHNRGGFTLRLPTGTTGTPRGISTNSTGEGHGSVGAYFHFNWYPLTHGIRNAFRIEGTNELVGKRETLDGEKGYYSAGHRADLFYNWSIERQNIFAGTELHYSNRQKAVCQQENLMLLFLKR